MERKKKNKKKSLEAAMIYKNHTAQPKASKDHNCNN